MTSCPRSADARPAGAALTPYETLQPPRVDQRLAVTLFLGKGGEAAKVHEAYRDVDLAWFQRFLVPLYDRAEVQRLQEVVPISDLWVGLIKAPVFGFIIALAGCFNGMLVQGNSEEVGTKTTAAVVQSIFMVIILDAVFAIFFSQVGWI